MISYIESEDISELVKLAEEAHNQSQYGKYNFNTEFFERAFKSAICDTENYFCVKKTKDMEIVGAFLAYKTSMSFCDFEMAMDGGIFIKKEYRGSKIAVGMFREFFKWCKSHKTRPAVFIHYGDNNDKTYRFCEKMGLVERGRLFIGE